MGHLSQQRQGVRSTKRKPIVTDFDAPDTSLTAGKKEKDHYIKVYDARKFHNTVYFDQTGSFPYRSRRGNKYIMVMVEINISCILVEPMKSKTDDEMQRTYLHLVQRFKHADVDIQKHPLISKTCKYELVPPSCHIRNVAKVAIKTFKNHFIAVLSGVHDTFPMVLWDRLLPQVELTLNLLRQSNTTPTVSAHAHLFGPFDLNRMPLAPLGCPVHVHEPPGKRGTWAPHSKLGWNLGVSSEHYRCHRICCKDTMAERVSETVFFKHNYVTKPSLTHADQVIKAAHDLHRALHKRVSKKGDERLRGLQQLSEIFLDMALNEPPRTWETEYGPVQAAPPPPPPADPPRVAIAPPRVDARPTPAPPPRVPVATPLGTAPASPLARLSAEFAARPTAAPPAPPSAPSPPPPELIVASPPPPPKRCARELRALDVVPGTANLPARRATRASRSADLANAIIALDKSAANFIDASVFISAGKHVKWHAPHHLLNDVANA
ncbi:hypothetical protein ACHAWF_005412, partial [Thalassiosira exigua]